MRAKAASRLYRKPGVARTCAEGALGELQHRERGLPTLRMARGADALICERRKLLERRLQRLESLRASARVRILVTRREKTVRRQAVQHPLIVPTRSSRAVREVDHRHLAAHRHLWHPEFDAPEGLRRKLERPLFVEALDARETVVCW